MVCWHDTHITLWTWQVIVTAQSPSDLNALLSQVPERVFVQGPGPWHERPLARRLKRMGVSVTFAAGVAITAGPVLSGIGLLGGLGTMVGLASVSDGAQAALVHSLRPPASSVAGPGFDLIGLTTLEQQLLAKITKTTNRPSAIEDPRIDTLDAQTRAAWLIRHDEPFLALAATLEDLAARPYWDPGGLNVGAGYCISKRLVAHGEARVREDLAAVGVDSDDIQTLLSFDRRAIAAADIHLSVRQGLALLKITQGDYQAIAQATLGLDEERWQALPAHRQASLTWLAYNTGANGLAQFKRLKNALDHDDHDRARQQLMPHYMDQGVAVANRRAGAFLAAAYQSHEHMALALAHPAMVEAQARDTNAQIDETAYLNQSVTQQRLAAAQAIIAKLDLEDLPTSHITASLVDWRANRQAKTQTPAKTTGLDQRSRRQRP